MSFGEIFMIMFGAVAAENLILTKCLGACLFLRMSEKPSDAARAGAAVTLVMTVSSAATWAVYHFILVRFGFEYLRTAAFVLVIATLVGITKLVIKKYLKPFHNAFGDCLPLLAANCAVFGVALLNINKGYTFGIAVMYGMFSAVGFTFAILVFAGMRERLRFVDPPAAFRGIPLALVSAGLLAMAFSGFQGMKIF